MNNQDNPSAFIVIISKLPLKIQRFKQDGVGAKNTDAALA